MTLILRAPLIDTAGIQKEVGAFLALNFIEGVEAFTAVPFIDVLGWSKEEVTVFNAKVRQDAKKRECHLVYDL